MLALQCRHVVRTVSERSCHLVLCHAYGTQYSLKWRVVGCARGYADDVVNMRGAKTVLTGERGINRVTLLGRAGQDPQIRGSTENPITVFPVATSYTLKTRDGNYVQKTEWHRVTVFRPVLKDLVSQFVKKGDRVYVTGSITYGQYVDKNSSEHRVASIVAEDVINLTRSMTNSGGVESSTSAEETDHTPKKSSSS